MLSWFHKQPGSLTWHQNIYLLHQFIPSLHCIYGVNVKDKEQLLCQVTIPKLMNSNAALLHINMCKFSTWDKVQKSWAKSLHWDSITQTCQWPYRNLCFVGKHMYSPTGWQRFARGCWLLLGEVIHKQGAAPKKHGCW